MTFEPHNTSHSSHTGSPQHPEAWQAQPEQAQRTWQPQSEQGQPTWQAEPEAWQAQPEQAQPTTPAHRASHYTPSSAHPQHTPAQIPENTDIKTWQPPLGENAPGAIGRYPYHRLFRILPTMRWWKPVVLLALGAPSVIILSIVVALFFQVGGTNIAQVAEGTPQTIGELHFMFVSIIVMFFAFLPWFFVLKIPFSTVFSVLGRIRWRLLGIFFALVIAIFLPSFVVLLVIDGSLSPATWSYHPAVTSQNAVWLLVLIFVSIPLQSVTEEFVFRGVAMQSIGTWLKHPAFAAVISAAIFALMHAYGKWSLASVFLFGLVASWLTIRTGGLEASIAMHVVNNQSAGLIGLFIIGEVDASGDGEVIELVSSLIMMLIYVVAVEGVMRYRARRQVEAQLGESASLPDSHITTTTPSLKEKTAHALLEDASFEVLPQFPNRPGDSDPRSFGVTWQGKQWQIFDTYMYASMFQQRPPFT